jgi:hypothetical protein
MLMHRHARIIALLALTLGIVSGCSSTSAPKTTVPSETLNQALHTVLPATVTVPSNVDTTASLLFTLHVSPVKAAGAAFETGGQLVDAGNVWIRTVSVATLDSVQLTETIAATGGRMITVYGALLGVPATSHDLPFDGTKYHVFHVAGSTSISAFIDSIKSVHDIDVTAPAENAVIPRSGGLTVTWGDAGADTAVKVVATVIAGTDSTLRAAADVVADPAATLQIPSTRLNLLPNGAARLAIARFRLTYSIEGTHVIGMICETVEVRDITLN